MSLGGRGFGQIGRELSALYAANLSSHWQPAFLKSFVYANVLVLSTRFTSRCSLLVAWPWVIAKKIKRRQKVHLPQGGRRKMPLACFRCGWMLGWTGWRTRLCGSEQAWTQCTEAVLGGTGTALRRFRLWCPLNAGGTCLHVACLPSWIAHGVLFTLGCPAPGLTRAELSFLSILHGQ